MEHSVKEHKGSKASAQSAAEMGERLDEIHREVSELSNTLQESAQDVRSYLQSQARAQPYIVLGVAIGTGFILGGGLTPKVSRSLFRLGGRLASNYLLREVLGV